MCEGDLVGRTFIYVLHKVSKEGSLNCKTAGRNHMNLTCFKSYNSVLLLATICLALVSM